MTLVFKDSSIKLHVDKRCELHADIAVEFVKDDPRHQEVHQHRRWGAKAQYECKIPFERCGLTKEAIHYFITEELRFRGHPLDEVSVSISPLNMPGLPYILILGRDRKKMTDATQIIIGSLPTIHSRYWP
jgi:hypothetical protein